MFIEEAIEKKKNPPVKVGMEFDVEYSTLAFGDKFRVVQSMAGTVFIGSRAETSEYIKQARAQRALRTAERGLNPILTR